MALSAMTEPNEKDDAPNEKNDAVDLIQPGDSDHLRMIIEGSIDGILVGNAKGQITRANTAFLNMIGCTEDEILGRRMGG